MIKEILLIEDDKKKIEDISAFIQVEFPNCKLVTRESYQTGMRELVQSKFDILLLDMSLPTWEAVEYEVVGSFEKFGGFNIMKELKRKRLKIKTILITMFDDFGESDSSITLSQIDYILKNNFSDFYVGYVFYNSRENNWQTTLKTHLSSL